MHSEGWSKCVVFQEHLPSLQAEKDWAHTWQCYCPHWQRTTDDAQRVFETHDEPLQGSGTLRSSPAGGSNSGPPTHAHTKQRDKETMIHAIYRQRRRQKDTRQRSVAIAEHICSGITWYFDRSAASSLVADCKSLQHPLLCMITEVKRSVSYPW